MRDAVPGDFPELLRLTLEGLGHRDALAAIGPHDHHPFHQFALTHGRVIVAEHQGHIAGYASAVEIDGVRIVSQVFVRQDAQSSGIGRTLVDAIDPVDNVARHLVASSDLRALAIYIQRGFIPYWPVYTLRLSPDALDTLPASDGHVLEHARSDRLIAHISYISGRSRSSEMQYWANDTGGTVFQYERSGEPAGFGWLQDPQESRLAGLVSGDAPAQLGPVGVLDSADAVDCVLAMLATSKERYPNRGAVIEIGGPHSALPLLLRAGGRIMEVEILMSTDVSRIGDAERYIPFGGLLY